MRFVVVNGLIPEDTHCAFCPAVIVDKYVRDTETGIVYCSHFCLEAHIYATNQALGNLDAPSITYIGPKEAL